MSQPTSIKAVIFDWAGTTVDYGSRAPAQVFVEIFHSRGVDVTTADGAREAQAAYNSVFLWAFVAVGVATVAALFLPGKQATLDTQAERALEAQAVIEASRDLE